MKTVEWAEVDLAKETKPFTVRSKSNESTMTSQAPMPEPMKLSENAIKQPRVIKGIISKQSAVNVTMP